MDKRLKIVIIQLKIDNGKNLNIFNLLNQAKPKMGWTQKPVERGDSETVSIPNF